MDTWQQRCILYTLRIFFKYHYMENCIYMRMTQQLYIYSGYDINKLQQNMNEDLRKIQEWMTKHQHIKNKVCDLS